jgi:adenylate cyclase
MSDVFISYARSTARQAQQVAEALRGLGYSVWIDDDLPAHRTYSRVIEEQMAVAKATVVIWSADAVQSEWVLSEANRAREDRKLVQLATDKSRLPMPFDTVQCTDLAGWSGDTEAAGWRKVAASVADLVGGATVTATQVADVPLPLPSKPSIAVIPFTNLSGDPEQDYFADGMVVEIVEALSRIRSIFVIASGSSLSFKGKGVGAQDAARQLGVRFVLEGSVRKAGGRVRIGVQLIDAADSTQIWSHHFEDTLEDVFALQDRIAVSVAGVVEPSLHQAEIRRASVRPTDNMGSYDLHLRALPLLRANVRRRSAGGARSLQPRRRPRPGLWPGVGRGGDVPPLYDHLRMVR